MRQPKYTHGHAESVLRSHRIRTADSSAAYLLPHLHPGLDLLDIGSGPGTITTDLAQIVAPSRVTAVETSDELVELTRQEALRRGCDTVDVVVGDVHSLKFPDSSFDVVHAHQVLQHVHDPVQALREMVRVCRPGGIVAVRDADYGGFIWYPESPRLQKWRDLYCAVARANGGEPNAGRHLLAWAHAAGAKEVEVSASAWCYADPTSRQEWGSMWAERVTDSSIARQLLETGMATREEVLELRAGWTTWANDPDGYLSIPHTEILIHV